MEASPLPVKGTHLLSMFGIRAAFHCATPVVTRGFGYIAVSSIGPSLLYKAYTAGADPRIYVRGAPCIVEGSGDRLSPKAG